MSTTDEMLARLQQELAALQGVAEADRTDLQRLRESELRAHIAAIRQMRPKPR